MLWEEVSIKVYDYILGILVRSRQELEYLFSSVKIGRKFILVWHRISKLSLNLKYSVKIFLWSYNQLSITLNKG